MNRGQKVIPQVLDAVPATLSLVFGAAVLWVVGGLLVGLVAAATRDTVIDRGLMILALIGISMPVFWLGAMMNLVSQSRYHDTWLFSWVPGLGYVPLTEDPVGWFKALVIPWFTLAALYIGIYGRVLRANLIESYSEDYIRTARAKGLSETRILLRHALRMSLVSFVTMFGLDFGVLVGGAALLTEVVFGINGVGRLTFIGAPEPRSAGDPRHGDVRLLLRGGGERGGRHALRRDRPEGARVTEPKVLDVAGLNVSFRTEDGPVNAVHDVSFEVGTGEILCIVGESGSGKTVSLLSILGLIDRRNTFVEGAASFRGQPLLGLSPRRMRRIRGGEIAYRAAGSDDGDDAGPHHRLADRGADPRARRVSRGAARARAVALLGEVGIPDADQAVDRYPHQLSGGMRQRAVIAMALSCNPKLVIADEPTTALDVTVQAQVLDLLRRLRHTHGSSVVLITHDMGVVAEMADRVVVMYAGRVVESGSTRDVFLDPWHPYTWGLLASIPPLDGPRAARLPSIPGQPPLPREMPPGCAFAPRCAARMAVCAEPPPVRRGEGRRALCFLDAKGRAEARLAAAG